MNNQFKKGVMKLCVLHLISEHDYYGYELVNTLVAYLDVSEGAIYQLLKLLCNQNCLETYIRESSTGPARKYYQLTKEGEDVLSRTYEEWGSFVKSIEKIIKINP